MPIYQRADKTFHHIHRMHLLPTLAEINACVAEALAQQGVAIDQEEFLPGIVAHQIEEARVAGVIPC
jgi:hypothetical protein